MRFESDQKEGWCWWQNGTAPTSEQTLSSFSSSSSSPFSSSSASRGSSVRCDARKGAFRAVPPLPPLLPETHRPRSRDGRLRGRNGQYAISLPSVTSRLRSSFSSILLLCSCFSGSLLPLSLAASPPFPPCALNTNTLPLLPACTVRPLLKTH